MASSNVLNITTFNTPISIQPAERKATKPAVSNEDISLYEANVPNLKILSTGALEVALNKTAKTKRRLY